MTFETDNQSLAQQPTKPNGYFMSALLILFAATSGVAVVFVLAQAFGDQLRVAPEFGSAPATEAELPIVLGATVMLGLVGLGLAGLIGRFAPNPRAVFFVGSVIGLVAYGALAFLKADTIPTALWLNVMHLVAAVPIVGGILSHRTKFLSMS